MNKSRRTGKAAEAENNEATSEVKQNLQSVIENTAPVLADSITEQSLVSAFALMQSGYCGPRTRALLESFGGGVSPLEEWGNTILQISPVLLPSSTESIG